MTTIMIFESVKDDGLPGVCVAQHIPLRYGKKISANETVCYGFVCCQETGSYFTSVFPKVVPSPSLACVATHRSRQKNPLHFAN